MRIGRFGKSLEEAWRGLRSVYRSEQNFRLQFYVAILVFILAAIFRLKPYEIIVVILLAGLVLTMELLNTALEYCTDLLKPRLNHYVQLIKETMAAAVLMTACMAAIIGLIIFVPHFLAFLK